MKKFFVMICASLLLLTGCSTTKENGMQPNSFFPESEERFILVDVGYLKGGYSSEHTRTYIYADTITGVMYTCNFDVGWFSPLYNSDGSLMIYDPIN